MIRENQRCLNKLLVLTDVIVIFLSAMLSYFIRFHLNLGVYYENNIIPVNVYVLSLIFIIPMYLILFNIFGLYLPYRFKTISYETLNIIKSDVVGTVIFIATLYVFKFINYSRYLIFIFFVVLTLFMFLERLLLRVSLRFLRRKGYNVKNILFIGISDMTYKFIKQIQKNKQWGYAVKGILYDEYPSEVFSEIAADYSVKNTILHKESAINDSGILEKHLLDPGIDDVLITLPFDQYYKMKNIIKACEKAGVKAQIIPDFSDKISSKPYVEEIGNIPMIGIRYIPLENLFNRMLKRTFDVLFSVLAIIIVSPIMILTAIMIKLTSPGPVIFKQKRVGLNKKEFIMYKFRSMRVQNSNKEKIEWTTKDDPRKTKFGSFIRKTSIDELPQFFNVLKGDMSLIGPRPERPYFVNKFKDEIPKYMVKHQVRPGITGWAQVNGWRGNTSISKRIQYDIYYIENWSFMMDIKIVFLTIFKGFVNKNAY
ncbi:undecaprenyl-phosphate glucose phosphotransferase [uncultured Clostridium sp.]|uniref:undecaprenyl-phosphate glucose phosphotransferase n=1 Tax=uncultured Clostridium sp. TaxID=59620 RepID=UPI0025DEB4CE|nr:undecaprenyl-phosphate glucose phosphotransferase [uncultured Clostridium sp.]